MFDINLEMDFQTIHDVSETRFDSIMNYMCSNGYRVINVVPTRLANDHEGNINVKYTLFTAFLQKV